MKNENTDIKPKNKISKKLILTVLIIVLLACALVGGYFIYKNLFPADKELFFMSHANSLDSVKQEEPEQFFKTNKTTITTEGDFTSKKAAKRFSTTEILTDNLKLADDKTEYNFKMNFLGNDVITTKAVKVGDTEVFSFPQLAEKSYGADSYYDILSVLTGSEKAEDKDMLDGVDKEQFEIYLKKYIKKLYENLPDSDFTSQKDGDVKTITLKSDLNRAIFDITNEIKNDSELRDFLYNQDVIIKTNINKKYAFFGTIIKIHDKDEYNENYEKSISEFIEDIEDSVLVMIIKVNKDRKIISEDIVISNNEKVQWSLSYDKNHFSYEGYEDDLLMLKIDAKTSTKGAITDKETNITLDINDYTKEISDKQKMVTLNIVSKMDTNVSGNIVLPDDYIDMRKMSVEEKQEITEEASRNFMTLLATLTMELLS